MNKLKLVLYAFLSRFTKIVPYGKGIGTNSVGPTNTSHRPPGYSYPFGALPDSAPANRDQSTHRNLH
jgi:hypothetical protein